MDWNLIGGGLVALGSWALNEWRKSRSSKAQRALEQTERAASLAFAAVEGLRKTKMISQSHADAVSHWEREVKSYAQRLGFNVDWGLAANVREKLVAAEKAKAAASLERLLAGLPDKIREMEKRIEMLRDLKPPIPVGQSELKVPPK